MATGDAASAGFAPDRLARIDAFLRQQVDSGRLPGWILVISRAGQAIHLSRGGYQDIASATPLEADAMFRIFSMTKPVTSVAAMLLYEQGAFQLSDPLSRFIPAFADMRVYSRGPAHDPETRPASEPIRMWHLLTHTAGLTYAFLDADPVDNLYRANGFAGLIPAGTLAEACDRLARLPLLFEPGTEWNYSIATDVLGRVIEIASGQPLDEFLRQHVLSPLGMSETGFWVDDARQPRLTTLYPHPEQGGQPLEDSALTHPVEPPAYLSGGVGLISTAHDYHRFIQMLHGGGALDGVRILSPATLKYMTANHLPRRADIETFGRALDHAGTYAGVGFGLGFAINDDPVRHKVLGPAGTYGWPGAAGTTFWVDPAHDITVLFLTHHRDRANHRLQSQLRQLVYQALIAPPVPL